jgi:hypothetical protein
MPEISRFFGIVIYMHWREHLRQCIFTPSTASTKP